MKILYDSYAFLSYKTGGISRYHYELYKGIYNQGKHEVEIAGKFIKNEYLRNDKQFRNKFLYDPTASFRWLNKYLIRRKVLSRGYDLFHPSVADYYELEDISVDRKLVFTIHDMIVEKEDIELGRKKWEFAKRADRIIAVSEATKKDIVDIFGIDADKIKVIYHGSSLSLMEEKSLSQKPHLPKDYLLYVGNRTKYKNFKTFVTAIAPLMKENPELHLICIGKKSFSEDEMKHLDELNISKQVICYTQIDDHHLTYFYNHAKAFVFPSLAEGFGIPILEAWACQAPVVLSRIPCFEEVAGDAGHFFDPLDENSIRENVQNVIFDEELRKNLIAKGTERLKLFSWEKTVNQTQEVYESLFQ